MKNIHSTVTIDVIIVAIDKDFEVFVHIIDSIRKNIKYSIGDLIISGSTQTQSKICAKRKNALGYASEYDKNETFSQKKLQLSV